MTRGIFDDSRGRILGLGLDCKPTSSLGVAYHCQHQI